MVSAFHMLCSRYSLSLTPTAPTANKVWETLHFLDQPKAIKGLVKYTKAKKNRWMICGPLSTSVNQIDET